MNSGESRRGPGNFIRVSAAAVGLTLLTGCGVHFDNPFSKDKAPTVQDQFKKANQDCADEKGAEVAKGVTPEAIAAAGSLATLTEKLNEDAAIKTEACVTAATGIPEGTPGFDVQVPTITVAAHAAVARG